MSNKTHTYRIHRGALLECTCPCCLRRWRRAADASSDHRPTESAFYYFILHFSLWIQWHAVLEPPNKGRIPSITGERKFLNRQTLVVWSQTEVDQSMIYLLIIDFQPRKKLTSRFLRKSVTFLFLQVVGRFSKTNVNADGSSRDES